jgi:hypothetical protein
MNRLLLLCLVFSAALHAQEKNKQEIKLRGEVIDTKCYIAGSMGDATGEKHKDCAIMCAKAGVPLGLLEEKTKTVYFVAKLRGMAGANEMLLPFVAETVLVTGRVVEKGGAKMLMIESIEKAE